MVDLPLRLRTSNQTVVSPGGSEGISGGQTDTPVQTNVCMYVCFKHLLIGTQGGLKQPQCPPHQKNRARTYLQSENTQTHIVSSHKHIVSSKTSQTLKFTTRRPPNSFFSERSTALTNDHYHTKHIPFSNIASMKSSFQVFSAGHAKNISDFLCPFHPCLQ